MSDSIRITTTDFSSFMSWISLDLNSITSDGRNKKSFDSFWQSVFKIDSTLIEVQSKIDHLVNIAKTGPINSWLKWLRDKLYLYYYSHTGVTFSDFVKELNIDEGHFIFVLRNHFYQIAPNKEEAINEILSFGDKLSTKRDFTLNEILEKLQIPEFSNPNADEDVMTSLEVTVFPSWPSLIKSIPNMKRATEVNEKEKQPLIEKRVIIRSILEALALFLIVSLIFVVIKQSNTWYEKYIVSQIQVLEPSFLGLEKSLTYRPDDRELRKVELSNKEIDELEKIESAKNLEEVKGVRYDPESDEVVLTSVEAIPKSFDEASAAPSEFEESKGDKGGYRDIVAARGGSKAYRVLMASSSADDLKSQILPLMSELKVEQTDKVKPGTKIPGGMYFNLLVPSKNLKSFLERVTLLKDSTIFESNPSEPMPAGKNRVFIWVKSL